jgi:TetR/AcrR family transcriptional repressor of bet genes
MSPAETPAGAPPRGSAQAAERTHREILAATIGVIAEHSLSGTTIERVATAAGIAAGTVILHFKRKEALLVAALEHIAREFDAARRAAIAASGGDDAAALARLIDLYLDPELASVPKIAVWSAFWGEAGSRRVYMDRVSQVDSDALADLTRLFATLIAGGGYRHLDAEANAKAFAGLLEYFWQDILAVGEGFDRDRARATGRRFLAGLFPAEFAHLS